MNKSQTANKDFYAWSASSRKSISHQTLFITNGTSNLITHQKREVTENSYTITVYTRNDSEKTMGQVSLRIDPLASLEDQVNEALENARHIENPVWDLPAPPEGGFPDVISHDPQIEKDPALASDILSDQANEALKNLQGVQVNSAELFVNYHEKRTELSTGVVMPEKATDIYFEAAMEKLPLPNTQEVHRYKTGLSIEEMDLAGFLKDLELETISLDDTFLPPTDENATILINEEPVSSMLNALLGQLDAEAEYNRGPHFKENEMVVEENALSGSDALDVTLDPAIPTMCLTTAWTSEGLKARGGHIIANNIVLKQIIGNRMGQYLSKEPNGLAGNYVLPAGSSSKEELIGSVDRCIEILTFSSLLINPRTLTWSSEIKLGRLYEKGQFKGMIKGGVASGSIRENFTSAKYSNKLTTRNQVADSWHPAIGYRGPDFMLIRSGVRIAGE